MNKSQISFITRIIFISGLGILLYSVTYSGLFYQYNVDEIAHVQIAYLLAHGVIPFISIFLTLIPVFHSFLMILFAILGYSINSIMVVRVVMISLFILRLAGGFLLISKVFNKKTAFFFLPIILLDPFTVFNAMQIRPDNLMLTVYTAGLLIMVYGLEKSSKLLIFISGIIFGIAMVILLKILPSLAVLFAVLAVYFFIRKQIKSLIILFAGFILPWGAVFGYYAVQGLLPPMIQNVFLDRNTINSTLLNPVPIIYFFKGLQYELFGFPGRPLTWVYVWILPIIGFVGMIISAYRLLHIKLKEWSWKTVGRLILLGSLVLQWFWVFTVKGFFLQYLLTISWLWALFGAVFLLEMTEFIKKKIIFSQLKNTFLSDTGWIILFIIFAAVSVKANLNRSSVRGEQYWQNYQHYWDIVKPDEKTFPNILFRPISYPLGMGTFIGDIPNSILRRFGPVYQTLDKENVRYLILDSYMLVYLDPDSRDYISSHYQLMPGEKEIYLKVK